MQIIQHTIKENLTHLKLDFTKLQLNERVPFNIYIKKDEEYVILLKAGTLIHKKIYALLEQQTQLYILKRDEEKQELNCNSIEAYIKYNRDNNEKTLHYLYKIIHLKFAYLFAENFDARAQVCIANIVESIIFLVENDPDYLKNTLTHFSNEYKIDTHSLHVAIYAAHLGVHLGFDNKELTQITTAGLLHDIGLKKIDEDLLNKDLELTEHELQMIQRHPEYSVEIVKHNHIYDPYIIDAIMHHHERYDGTGYPNSLTKIQIHKNAAILAICDVFEALTNERPYRKRLSYFEALKFMIKDPSMAEKFNHDYLQVFLKSLI